MKKLQNEIAKLYSEIYNRIDPSYGTMNRSEEEAFRLDDELVDLISEFELEGCDGDIDNDSERDLVDLSFEELTLLKSKLVEFSKTFN